MSMVGYILGLGDRHPSNLMMSRKTGKIIHIDFGDCFEVAMKRDKFPEKVPFRLTKMLVKALEASGVGGTFKIISEKKKLTEIQIPSKITSIGDRTFEKCCKLKNVQIPDSVVHIGNNSFLS